MNDEFKINFEYYQLVINIEHIKVDEILTCRYIMGLTTFSLYPWDIEKTVNHVEEV